MLLLLVQQRRRAAGIGSCWVLLCFFAFAAQHHIGGTARTGAELPLFASAFSSPSSPSPLSTSDSKEGARSSSSSSLLPPPTPADAAFESWARRSGIFFSPEAIRCLTTDRSVGGRGLFVPSPIKSGQVLASIPHSLVFSSGDEDEHWIADITRQVLELEDDDCRKEWVDSWNGGGCTSWDDAVAFAGELLNADDDDGGSLLVKEVKKKIKKRKEFWKEAAAKFQLNVKEDFPLFSLVSSRACFLGPSWATDEPGKPPAVGVVPLFDMLNHCPAHVGQNVELMSAGTAFQRMMNDSKNKNQESSSSQLLPVPDGLFNDKDMLLIATKNIEAGTELLTSYVDENAEDAASHGGDEETSGNSGTGRQIEIKATKLVQWGFL